MKAHLFVIGAAAVAAALGAGCTSGPPAPVNQQSQTAVLEWRADKDAMFKTSKDSPLLPDARASFTGLSYWPIDTAYRVPAGLTQDRSGQPVIIQLQTSTDEKRRMQKVGTLGFTLRQQAYQLTAFADLDTNDVSQLFVPFGDLTNNKDTYGGGRYIELAARPRAFTIWTSTAPTIRSACSTRATAAPCRRARTACRYQFQWESA